MSKVLINEQSLEDIADSIRAKNGTQDTYTPSEMSEAIDNIPSVTPADVLDEYFETQPETLGSSTNGWAAANYFKKLPMLILPDTIRNAMYLFEYWTYPFIPKVICGNNLTDMTNMYGFSVNSYTPQNVSTVDLTGLDTSNVTKMLQTFMYMTALQTIDFSTLDLSKVTDIGNLFAYDTHLTTITGLNKFTAALTNISGVFNCCSVLSSVDGIQNWNVSNCTSLANVFSKCSSLSTLNISGWNTDKNTSLNGFTGGSSGSGCSATSFIVGENFDTSKVKDFVYAFHFPNATELDLHTVTVTSATNMNSMFKINSCRKLDIRNCAFTKNSSTDTYKSIFSGGMPPVDCLIIVKDDDEKTWLTNKYTTLTNVQTVAEYEASQAQAGE